MRRTEGRLSFEFKTAFSVSQPEVRAQPLRCADFIVEESGATWMIEVTEAIKAPEAEYNKAVSELLGQLKSGNMMRDMLMKLYGCHAHMAIEKLVPAPHIYFCAIIGLPKQHDDAAQRSRVKDQIQRVVWRIGPSFHGAANRPTILVESIDSWNSRQPQIRIA